MSAYISLCRDVSSLPRLSPLASHLTFDGQSLKGQMIRKWGKTGKTWLFSSNASHNVPLPLSSNNFVSRLLKLTFPLLLYIKYNFSLWYSPPCWYHCFNSISYRLCSVKIRIDGALVVGRVFMPCVDAIDAAQAPSFMRSKNAPSTDRTAKPETAPSTVIGTL